MKKIFFIAIMLSLSISSNAQVNLQSGGSTLSFRKSSEFSDKTISGSKYFDEGFKIAKVNKGTQDFSIRYNAYSDIMEYKNGNDLLDLIKEQNTYFQFSNGDIYELMNYTFKGKEVSRYNQVLLDKNNVKISKYKSIKLIEAKPAATMYDAPTAATYKPNEDIYFVTYNNQTVEFDGKSKILEKLIPSKASEIKQFFKQNKIKENDGDMIKVGNFLATL